MSMKTKKILSLVLAVALAVSVALPALAEENTANTITMTGEVNMPVISVALSANAGAITLNPYKLSYSLDGADKTDQIITKSFYVISNSQTPIKVDAVVTGIIPDNSGAAFAAATTAKSTKKEVYLWLDAKPGTYQTVTSYKNKSDETDVITAAEYEELEAEGKAGYDAVTTVSGKDPDTWDSAFSSSATNMVLVKKGANSKANILTLSAATVTDGTAPSVGAFKFFGDMTASPAATIGDWTEADKVNVTVAFTFTADAVSTTTTTP
jgi:hypothetical protein